MNKIRIIISILLAITFSFGFHADGYAEEHHHAGDYAFGIVEGAASVIEPEPDEVHPIHLYPFVGSLFNGDWGMELWGLPDPDVKSVRVRLQDVLNGLVIYHEGDLVYGFDGSTTGVGYFDMSLSENEHAHLDVYAVAPGDYSLQFKLINAIDKSNNPAADSGWYAIDFETVPEPGTLVALAVPLFVLVVRKRK